MTSTLSDLSEQLVQIERQLQRQRADLERLQQERIQLQDRLKEIGRRVGDHEPGAKSGRRSRAGGASQPLARSAASATKLIRSALAGEVAAVRRQLSAGADPNSLSPEGEPVLVLASLRDENVQAVCELLKAGAEVDRIDEEGNTALIGCVRDENMKTVQQLVEHGADVNARNRAGDTPLTNAACWGSRRVVRYLLAHGADPALPNGVDMPASELARQHGHAQIVAMLERARR